MQQVGTAVLKNNLSAYLRKVKKGARLIVTDHGRPVAKIIPIGDQKTSTQEEILASLASEGFLELPPSNKRVKVHQKIDLGGDLASQYIIEEREKGW